MNIIERISQTEIAKSWRSQLMTTGTRQLITGLSGSAKTLLMAGALQKTHQKIVIAVPNLYYANQLVDDFLNILPSEQVHLFPVDEVLSAEMVAFLHQKRAQIE